METTHRQTAYLITDESGKLHIFQYAPTMNYAGRRDSDQYALMQGIFIDTPSHDLAVGSIVACHRNVGTPSGIHTTVLNCDIVAKQSFDWDMSKPVGERKSNVEEAGNFTELFKKYRDQK